MRKRRSETWVLEAEPIAQPTAAAQDLGAHLITE